jgi:hypothetical protein
METISTYTFMTRVFLLVGILFFAGIQGVNAASLYLSPATGTYKVGDTIAAAVYAESTNQAMNAVSGTVSVPSDMFDVLGVSNSGSIVNFWVQEPIKQGAGATFEGVVLNPGYTGSAGKIATITMRAKKAGAGSLSFVSASILANDGKGTNLLSGTRGGSYTVQEGAVPKPVPVEDEDEEEQDEEPTGPDTEGPRIDVFTEIVRESKSDPFIRVRVRASDDSGIASYDFSLDGGAYLPWEDSASGIYEFNAGAGAHTLTLRVVDSYGNETRDYILINVVPLQTPRILSYPQVVTLGDTRSQITGDTPSGISKVVLVFSPQLIAKNIWGGSVSALPQRIETVVNTDGTWSTLLTKLQLAGEYYVTATGYDARGASSFPTAPVHVSVRSSFIATTLGVLLSWPLLLGVVILLSGLLWWKRKHVRAHAGAGLAHIKKTLDAAFSTMHRNIKKERTLLSHRDVGDKEEEIQMLDALEENVETTKERLENELEKLQDEK